MKSPDLLVGTETSDDAGVYRISVDTAVITTIDFFPPIVDDPFTFGEIAAANALSDVYAMGGSPRLALNIVCFPRDLGLDVLDEIIRGSIAKLDEAGVLLIGGHSVEDHEVKYGLAVTGFVHPGRVVRNSVARPGDRLVLTKPIGTGVVTSALKARSMAPEDAGPAIASMKELNKTASEAMVRAGVSACTDVTGYGLIGHAIEMARGSGAGLVIDSKEVLFLPRAKELMGKKKNRPRTLGTNRDFLMADVKVSGTVDEATELLLYDPQTSGGLLISVPPEKVDALMEDLSLRGINARVIGEVVTREEGWWVLVR